MKTTTTILTSQQVEANLKELKARHIENSSYRLQNYLNCVDDYSFGGLCDKAQDEHYRALSRVLGLVKEQEENGGYIIEELEELELQTLAGEFVSKNIIQGKFGLCFMYGSESKGLKFVGLSKKQSTYDKKGFKVVSRVYKVKVVYTGRITSRRNPELIIELLGVNESIKEKITPSLNDSYLLYKLKNL